MEMFQRTLIQYEPEHENARWYDEKRASYTSLTRSNSLTEYYTGESYCIIICLMRHVTV